MARILMKEGSKIYFHRAERPMYTTYHGKGTLCYVLFECVRLFLLSCENFTVCDSIYAATNVKQ